MAFDATNMNCQNHGAIREWMYPSGADDVSAVNYFDSFSTELKVGDVIVSLPTAGGMRHYQVTDITSGVVTVVGSQIV